MGNTSEIIPGWHPSVIDKMPGEIVLSMLTYRRQWKRLLVNLHVKKENIKDGVRE